MAISRESKAAIRALMDGSLPPGDKVAQAALVEVFKENPAAAKSLIGDVPKEYLEKAMKTASVPSSRIGDILYDSILDRAEFFRKEQTRAKCIGKPGFDEHGYPTGFGIKDPFAPGVTAEALGLDRRRGVGLEKDGVAMKDAEEIREETNGDWLDQAPGADPEEDEDLWGDMKKGPQPEGAGKE